MQPEFVTKPAFTVAGKSIHTKPMTPEIPALWNQYGPSMGTLPHLAEPDVSYGVMAHFDQTIGELDYLAGEAVTQTDDLPADLTRWEVPTNTYAVFETTLTTINQTFAYIYETWLPTASYQQLDAPYFERYDETFNPHDPNAKLAIYIPVAKKA